MYEIGFSIEVILWFHSYLTGRSQSVLDLDHSLSDAISSTSEVPQGSIIGPILFLMMINSVAKRIKYSKYGLFDDDKYAYYHFKCSKLNEAACKINTGAQAVADWAKDVGLELNHQKTKVMILGSNRKLKSLDDCDLPLITVDGNAIPFVNSTKHLVVYITNNIS
ncbi:uncharacterized protein LOC141537836 [Cotesia typhae]|uniref:uncharacterized protein LOC141537836 n=1 Tax=Cotesia typhae TaxID=2053667 RepID=UPI003D684EB0